MNNNDELKEWSNLLQRNSFLKKQIKKYEKLPKLEEEFFDDLKVCDKAIFSSYGIGYNKINAITVKKIIDVIINLFENKNEFIFISSDGNKNNVEIIKDLIYLNNTNKKLLTFENYDGFDKKFVSDVVKKIKPFCSIHLSKSVFSKDLINITLFDGDGRKLENNILEGIVKQISKDLNGFMFEKNKFISFLDNEMLIKIFSEKFGDLFSKSTHEKKTKIAISNRSNGITKILSKLIGSHDFSYVVNNNIKNKEITIFSQKNVNLKSVKTYFKQDIKFAKKEKANFLIIYNQEGTQFFCFAIHGSKVIFLDSDLLSLIFLHDFFNNLILDNKKIPNLFIASDLALNENIFELKKKYEVNFRKINNNNFTNFNEYMLLYWNVYNQYVFGEKINDEFTIYHLLIKIIGIVDNYISQYNSINSLLNNLEKMYGERTFNKKSWVEINEQSLINLIYNFMKTKRFTKLVATEIKIYDFENHLKNNIETNLCEFVMKNGSNVYIKYNIFHNCIYFYIRYKKTHNIFKDIKIHFENKKIISNILKSKN